MKKIELTIEGQSLIANITFYDGEILKNLQETEEGEFDLLDFISEYQKHDVMLGRGFCTECEPIIKVLCGDEVLYKGGIYKKYSDPNDDISKIKKDFKEENDVEYDDVISGFGDFERNLNTDAHFFKNINTYKYCSLEKVECIAANSSVCIEVEDDFKLSDLEIIFMAMDSGDNNSLSQRLYEETGLEAEVFGVKYKKVFYEFEGNDYTGGDSEFVWLKNNDSTWMPACEIESRIEELGV